MRTAYDRDYSKGDVIPTRRHAIVQRIAHKRLHCDWPGCPYGHRIDPGETYEWDVRLGGGWDRCYHLDCHRAAVHKPEPKEPEIRPGPPFAPDPWKIERKPEE